MNWFKRLFCKELQEDVVEIRPSRIPKDISEPVISFLKVFEKNPKRFKIRFKSYEIAEVCTMYFNSRRYIFEDSLTKETWDFIETYSYGVLHTLPKFLTKDEQELIVQTIGSYYKNRRAKLSKLEEIRKLRNQVRERERLTKIYQEEL